MHVFVRVGLPDQRTVELAPEAIIGRMRTASLRLNDPAVSEAHAMVSLRGSTLKLLSLRGRFLVDGVQLSETILRVGQRIELGPRLVLEVLMVSMPPQVLALRTEGLPLQVLPAVASILQDAPELVPGFVPHAEAVLWLDDERVWVRQPGHEDVALEGEQAIDVAGRTYVVERVQLDAAGAPATTRSVLQTPITLTLRYDSVHVQLGDQVAGIDGIPARILCELAELACPVEWRTVAREVWPHEEDEQLLRRNWDAGLARLRRAFVEHGLRGDLVRAAGRGRVELFLRPGDRVLDRQ